MLQDKNQVPIKGQHPYYINIMKRKQFIEEDVSMMGKLLGIMVYGVNVISLLIIIGTFSYRILL